MKGDLIEMYISLNGLDEIKWKMNPVVNNPKVGALARYSKLPSSGVLEQRGKNYLLTN